MATTRRAAAAVEKWTWPLIFIGMALIGLGVSVSRSDAAPGHVMVVAGAVAVLIGVVLIVVRSRMKESRE